MKLKYHTDRGRRGNTGLFCELCRYAREHGGRDTHPLTGRGYGRLLIDFPPDTLMHTVCGGLDLNEIPLHYNPQPSDHLYAIWKCAGKDLLTLSGDRPFTFYSSKSVRKHKGYNHV